MLINKMRWTFYSELLEDEFRECRGEGRDVSAFRGRLDAISMLPAGEEREEAARRLLSEMEQTPVADGFPYVEPTEYAGITAALAREAQETWAADPAAIKHAIEGAWYGRVIGCVLGIPVEGWQREKIKSYLLKTGQYPLSDYLSSTADERLRLEFDIHETDETTPYDRQFVCWRNCMNAYPNDDDINYTVLALKVLERFGQGFSSADMAETWLLGVPAFHACTAERAAIRNMMTGSLPPETGMKRNPFREWIGAQIRADMFGYVRPGQPMAAAELAYRDACVSHTKNGVYGEMFIAALLSLCFLPDMTMEKRIRCALRQIPGASRLHEALTEVCDAFDGNRDFDEVIDAVHSRYDERLQFDWCLTIPNAMIVTACLLWKESYMDAVSAAICAGFDTDCNGATVGSAMGLAGGRAAIPERLLNAFPAVLHTSVHGYYELPLAEAIDRTVRQVR